MHCAFINAEYCIKMLIPSESTSVTPTEESTTWCTAVRLAIHHRFMNLPHRQECMASASASETKQLRTDSGRASCVHPSAPCRTWHPLSTSELLNQCQHVLVPARHAPKLPRLPRAVLLPRPPQHQCLQVQAQHGACTTAVQLLLSTGSCRHWCGRHSQVSN